MVQEGFYILSWSVVLPDIPLDLERLLVCFLHCTYPREATFVLGNAPKVQS